MAVKTDKPDVKPAQKFFDVAKPGKLAGSATSRPVIISNRPLLQDPMMSPPASEASSLPAEPQKITIKPLDENRTESNAEETVVNGVLSAPKAPKETDEVIEVAAAVETPVVEKPVEPKDLESAPEEEHKPMLGDEPAEEHTEETAENDAPVEVERSKEEKEVMQLEAEAKRQEELDRLAESKEYFLPINSVEKRRSKVVSLLGLLLIIILGLLLITLLLDAGFIRINGVKPLTHFSSS